MKTLILKQSVYMMIIFSFVALGSLSSMGCAGRTKTATVTTQATDSGVGSGSTTSVTTQSKTVTTDAHPRGVIGGLFYTIGQVLIFPFRVIGNLFS